MTPPVVKTTSPSQTVKPVSEEISIGDTLRRLKNEQQFLGQKLYKQLASNLVAIPSDVSKQSPEQAEALGSLVSFLKNAEKFRNLIELSKNEEGKKLATIQLKKDILTATTDVKEVVYEYRVASELASTLSALYSSHTRKNLTFTAPSKLGEDT